MHKISKKIKKRDCANDVFITPDSLIEQHFKLVEPYLTKEDTILDPCCHETKKYYNKFIASGYKADWCEITLNRDFLTYECNCQAIIGNPPYSMIDDFLSKIIEVKPRVVSLLIGFGNITTRRLEFMEKSEIIVGKIMRARC